MLALTVSSGVDMQVCEDLVLLDTGSDVEICEDQCVIDVRIWLPCGSICWKDTDHDMDDATGSADNKDRVWGWKCS